jgi:hypothetical protein
MIELHQAPECEASPDQRHRFLTSTSCDYCGRGAIIVDGKVLYVPSLKQEEYHTASAKNVLFYGGRGSGKSVCGRWDAHMRALTTPGFKYCILRRTYPELEKSHLIDLPREMALLGGDWNATSKQARYPNGSIGFFSHCQNDQDALNLLSSEFYLMFFDEISTFEWEMFRKLAASVRVPRYMRDQGVKPMVRAATNPLGISAEMIDRYWVTHEVDLEDDEMYSPKDWLSIKANVEDNPYLDQQEYLAQFSGLPDHVRKAWVDGEFSLENALFDFKPARKNRDGLRKPYHVINELDFPKLAKAAVFYRAIDSGWFPDPTICLWIAHLGNRHIVFHEKIWYKTTAEDTAHAILEEDKRLAALIWPDTQAAMRHPLKVAITYCDPSMDINTTADIRTIKEVYEANGIAMENSINDRERYATAIHNTLAEEAGDGLPRIQFFKDPYNKTIGCPYLVRTIPQMRFKQNNPKAMDDHKDDHAVVALAYYLLSHSADQRSEIPFGKGLPKWMRVRQTDKFVLGRDNVRDKR